MQKRIRWSIDLESHLGKLSLEKGRSEVHILRILRPKSSYTVIGRKRKRMFNSY